VLFGIIGSRKVEKIIEYKNMDSCYKEEVGCSIPTEDCNSCKCHFCSNNDHNPSFESCTGCLCDFMYGVKKETGKN
jgi:hypothetical protein